MSWHSFWRVNLDINVIKQDLIMIFLRRCEILVGVEQQRIVEVKHSNQVREKAIQLFPASLSLARLF